MVAVLYLPTSLISLKFPHTHPFNVGWLLSDKCRFMFIVTIEVHRGIDVFFFQISMAVVAATDLNYNIFKLAKTDLNPPYHA